MEEYIVSARKYRPLNFDSVVGQRTLTTTLKNAIVSGKLAHAYLFCGPRGVGKTTCARIFAKAVNCLSPLESGDACGECESCLAFQQQRSMNIHELDAASNNSVEDIRELCKQVLIPPQIGRYKVFIIDEVHMLSSAAFNAFLKTLEEPPSYVIFILATTEKHKILPTILSRCQVYDFQRMTLQGTVGHLQYVAEKEGYQADPEALSLIAQKADGGMRDALSIFDQMVSFTGGELTYERVCRSLNVLSTEYDFRFVDLFLKNDVPSTMLLLDEILQKGYDGGNFIGGLATHLRNLLVSRDEATLSLLELSRQMQERYREQAARCTPQFLYSAIKLCNDCDLAYRTSRNKRLQLEITLIQAAQLTEEDGSSSGRCPAQVLKPIFQVDNEKAPAQEQASAVQPVPQTASPQPAVSAPSPLRPAPSPSPERVEHKPALKKVSFKNFGKKEDVSTEEVVDNEVGLNLVTPFTQEEMRFAWQYFINTLPHAQTAMAQRMRLMQPTLVGDSTVQVVVTNPLVQNELNVMRPALETSLRGQLKNCQVSLDVQLAEQAVLHRILSKPEQLKALQQRNPSIAQLVSELRLEID